MLISFDTALVAAYSFGIEVVACNSPYWSEVDMGKYTDRPLGSKYDTNWNEC